jgi:hypothetical protein
MVLPFPHQSCACRPKDLPDAMLGVMNRVPLIYANAPSPGREFSFKKYI